MVWFRDWVIIIIVFINYYDNDHGGKKVDS